MLAPQSQRGGPIIWPLMAKLFHPVFLQQRPRWTGGRRIPSLPVPPWNATDRPPSISFDQVNTQSIAADTAPVNFGLANLGVQAVPLAQFLHPQRPRTYYKQFRRPAVVHATPIPAAFWQISGRTKDTTGAVLGGCVVDLFVTSTDVRLETTTSNADGYYYFKGPMPGVTHYAVAYKSGAPDVTGATLNTLTAV